MIKQKVRAEIFIDSEDALEKHLSSLQEMLPDNDFVLEESSTPQPTEIFDSNSNSDSASNLLSEEKSRLEDRKYHRKRHITIDGDMPDSKFTSLLEAAGFVVIYDIDK